MSDWLYVVHIKLVTGESVNVLVLKLQASAMPNPGPSSLGSQVHAAAVNGDRSTLLKLIAGNGTRTHNVEGVNLVACDWIERLYAPPPP